MAQVLAKTVELTRDVLSERLSVALAERDEARAELAELKAKIAGLLG